MTRTLSQTELVTSMFSISDTLEVNAKELQKLVIEYEELKANYKALEQVNEKILRAGNRTKVKLDTYC